MSMSLVRLSEEEVFDDGVMGAPVVLVVVPECASVSPQAAVRRNHLFLLAALPLSGYLHSEYGPQAHKSQIPKMQRRIAAALAVRVSMREGSSARRLLAAVQHQNNRRIADYGADLAL